MKIVELDRETLGYDIDTSVLKTIGSFEEHEAADLETTREYIKDADVIIFNKTKMNEELLKDAPNVKLLAITATGFDNIDLEYCKSRGIAAANVKAYSTPAVAQHTFAMALFILEKISYYDEYVKSGKYSSQSGFCNFDEKYNELSGKTWGIIGMGNIGRSVAKIAEAFGCKVIFYSASGNSTCTDYERVDLDTLLKESDVLSIHCPLSDRTRNLINRDTLKLMKKSAILINVARGPVVNDADLAEALNNGTIAGAGLDVLGVEPMEKDNPLGLIKDSRKLLITPHMAWASVESRQRCFDEVLLNIKAFIEGRERNRLV
ncbi:D-2-hydroxyacid dehydrogenase [Lacrimispora saccharolytica]|uniref:D-2-hydroxyacid dehydrogenase n=1 Tax=Lacrimispora saccharolytica TaxID=84030 RepID=UPI00265D103B|nr:D-2-hydroxyacid dehydrogenase [Lacrimispora saccharolytica]MBS7329188.1 D-2-hydroxyacid dehydrogenase [Lachnospiraceae bacterium]MCF2657496.1 D-2-hydroxyacid dehydrogenase [Lacrimispora saccharolytica]MCI7558059.1 D-2-hydroxyacid dehydrogenase [Lachnospiraceae bacterium]